MGGFPVDVTNLGVFDDGSSAGPALYVGGAFSQAGGNSSDRIGRWECLVFGDLDGDGVVGHADLSILLGAWGPCPGPPEVCPADLDGDGNVGVTDFLLVLVSWT